MDARLLRAVVLVFALSSLGASYRTTNFIVEAPTPRLAEKIGRLAEQYRHDLAIEWIGAPLPQWPSPCPITAQVAPHLGAGGATSFVFQNGQVGSWRMTIQGSELRILDSVLPHEVTHTIFATHFRQPLPRWADEGACTTVEHESEKARHQQMLISFLHTDRGIAFSRMFAMKEYPRDVLPLYAEGFSLARFLISQGGRRKFAAFIGDGMRDENWVRALNDAYGVTSLAKLQTTWLDWVRKGSPAIQSTPAGPSKPPVVLAAVKRTRPTGNLLYRDRMEPLPERSATASSTSTPAPRAVASSARTESTESRPSNQWRAVGAGPQFAPGSIAAAVAVPSRHQAIRQQPIQRPKQTILR